jgi:hypothetical protein
MPIDQTRARVIGAVWKAIGQSGVHLSTLPPADQTRLVETIADGLMIEVNEILQESTPAVEAEPAEAGEQIKWEGKPFLSLSERYVITNERIKIYHGLFSRNVEIFELIRVKDLDFKQGVSERMFNIGDIFIRGHDDSHPEVILRNVASPEAVYETLRTAWLEARKRFGMQLRDTM